MDRSEDTLNNMGIHRGSLQTKINFVRLYTFRLSTKAFWKIIGPTSRNAQLHGEKLRAKPPLRRIAIMRSFTTKQRHLYEMSLRKFRQKRDKHVKPAVFVGESVPLSDKWAARYPGGGSHKPRRHKDALLPEQNQYAGPTFTTTAVAGVAKGRKKRGAMSQTTHALRFIAGWGAFLQDSDGNGVQREHLRTSLTVSKFTHAFTRVVSWKQLRGVYKPRRHDSGMICRNRFGASCSHPRTLFLVPIKYLSTFDVATESPNRKFTGLMVSLMLFRSGDLVCFRRDEIRSCQIERDNGFCLPRSQMSTWFVTDFGGGNGETT